MGRIARSFICGAVLCGLALPAAATVTFDFGITRGKAGNFPYSSIRFADSANPLDPSYSNVGRTVFALSGGLSGDIAGRRVKLTQNQTLSAEPTKYARNQLGLDDHVFKIRGGELAFSGGGDFLGGYVDYMLKDPVAMTLFSVGTLYLAGQTFSGGPENSVTPDFLALWGNNWNNAGLDFRDFERDYLWIDTPGPGLLLLAQQPRLAMSLGGEHMPEPSSALLFAAGAFVLARARRRRG